MKQVLFFIKGSLIAACGFSQYHPLVDVTHTWKCTQYGWIITEYVQYFEGDSIINGMTYSKLQTEYENGDVYQFGLIREDAATQKVYIWDGENERLLYDFTLDEGDEATVFGVGSEQTITITSVETVNVGETARKKLNFNDAWGPAYWIEGIGSMYGVPDAALGMVADYSPVVNCFY